ncbi:TadE/TadG family type IV pilus assembly protein [Actinacidiphila sp. ITFR-21]|uniref:TadE/TadG family type IV pilus assembly protein n=1 Tax=Actinacidiphila sp. ITFR-21 TaxID=3075199 RepID=UPI0037DA77EE
MLPFLLLVALAGIQLGIVAYCAEQAATAARTAARTAAQEDARTDPYTAGREAVSGWVDPDISFPGGTGGPAVRARATVRIPSVLPGLSLFGPVSRSATMPKEDDTP